jgi:hypothetical protein
LDSIETSGIGGRQEKYQGGYFYPSYLSDVTDGFALDTVGRISSTVNF